MMVEFPEISGGTIFNNIVLTGPDGVIDTYSKTHMCELDLN